MSEPKRTGLLQLLGESSGSQFVIPVYQRNYTWTAEKEVKQYLTDLTSVLKGEFNNHFMGIIIYLEKSIDFSTRELSVIDGQQRLTTTFLIIYAVKDMFVRNGETERVSQLEGQYLTNPYHTDKIKYKLKPLVSDDDVYRCIIEDRLEEIPDEKSTVLKNYRFIQEYLNDLLIQGFDANSILMALNKLYVVCVPISEEDNAQKIFESINATGVKLTAADLIRNYLLMNLDSETQEDFYAKYWKKIEDNVSADSKTLEMFFRMFLAVKTYTLVAKNAVYREFVKWVEEQNLSIEKLFKELLEYAKIFNFIMSSNINAMNAELRIPVTDFRKINSDLPMSIIMEFTKLFRKGKISDATLAGLISSINAYLLRRNLCDMDAQNISKLFPTILKKVLDNCNGDYSNIIKSLNQEMVGNNAGTSGSFMPTDKQMHELLHSANVYKRPALRTVLDRLELNNNPAPVDLSALSVEHLMPQTPSDEWLAELDTDMETYNDNLHRLGNLTLASRHDNSRMGNLGWEFKNEVLRDTGHLTLNMPLLEVERWDLQCIEDRTEELIDRICELYPYPEVSTGRNNEVGIVDETEALDIGVSKIQNLEDVECVKKRKIYRSPDGKRGYSITVSKMYPQGNKEKYWFAYREKRFADIADCDEQYFVLVCRNSDVKVLLFPKEFFTERLEKLNNSTDEEGNIKHYHIVIFSNADGRITMLLSKPSLREIDITEYLMD